jgi:death-on-curing protein
MSQYTLYPSLQETLYLHKRLIERFGGATGVRDMGLLESALSRPQSGYYKTLFEQAAALMQSLAMNHAFVDGNKRVAFAMTAIFLRLNGYLLRVQADNGESFLIDQVITQSADLEVIARWLQKNSKAV